MVVLGVGGFVGFGMDFVLDEFVGRCALLLASTLLYCAWARRAGL